MPTIKTTEVIDEIIELQERIETLEAELQEKQQIVIKRLGVGGTLDQGDVQVTVVQNTSYTVDFDALVAVKPGWARRVTRKVLDQARFTALRKADALPVEVAELIVEKLSEPYLRITKR